MMKGASVPTDEQLVEAFRKGDPEGFRGLVRRYQETMYGFAYRMTGNPMDADDLTQEIFLRVYRHLGKFRGEASFRTWLYRVARSRIANFRRRAVLDRLLLNKPEVRGPEAVPAEDPLVRKEETARLREMIASLPDRQRLTLILRFFQGLKYREIAEVLECSVGTAKANLFHAVRALRARLQERKTDGETTALDLP